MPSPGDRNGKPSQLLSEKLITRGAYLARVGGCVACHSQEGQPAFSGGAPINSPIGGMYPPNITPDKTIGIRNYSYGDFVVALRYGVNPKGQTFYPAIMP